MPNEKFPTALPEGTVLAGQFLIEEVLGQGGFGITYKAKDHKTGDTVAVKEYFPDTMVARTETTVVPYTGEREENFKYGLGCFLREAETLAKYVDNDGIVSIRSYFEENGTAYFVMDFVDGVSFDKYIKDRGGKIDFKDAKNVLLPIIDALGAVHKDGIVHRDVTPDNIYITKDGKVKLLDFGAARYSIGDKSRSLDVVLKHGYAPKEQYTRHGKQGPFTDIYTVGVCFYRAITGKLPVDSIDRLEEDDVVLPSTLGVKIEPYEEEAILKAMAVQPADRFKSMEEFKAALLNENAEPVKEEPPVVAQPEETIKCPSCGAENKIGTKFCKECGTNMTEPVTTVQEFKTVAITPEQEVKPKKKKWLIPVVAVVILALLAVGGYFGVRFIDDQNYKSDMQLAKDIKTAVVTGMMDPDTYDDDDSLDFIEDVSDGKSFDITKWKASENYFTKDVAEILSIKEYSELKNAIKTKGATGKIFVTIVSNEVMVEIEYSDRDNIVEGEISKKAWASLEEDDDTQVAEATPDPEPVADEPDTTVDPSPSPSATTISSDKGEFEDLTVNNAANCGYVAYDNATGYEYYWLPGTGLCKLRYDESGYELLDDTEDDIFCINIVGDYLYYVKGGAYICSITKSGEEYTEEYLANYFDDGDIYRWYINDQGFFAVIRTDTGSYELAYYGFADGSPDTIYTVYDGNVIMSGDYIYWANSEDEMYCVKLEDFGVKTPNVIDFGDYGFSYSGYNLAAFDGYVYTVCHDTANAGETYIVAMDNEGIQLWDAVTEANGLTVCDEGIYYYYTDWSGSDGNNTRIYSYPDVLLYETEEGMRAWSITIAPCYGEEYSILRVYGYNESWELGYARGYTDGYGDLYYSFQ